MKESITLPCCFTDVRIPSPYFVTDHSQIEHSENKVIMQSGLSGNEVGPGGLQSNLKQTFVLQE